MKKKLTREELLELRQSVFLGLHEMKKVYDETSISYRKKPEVLFKTRRQRAKMRIAKMIELLRRIDPQFEKILFRLLNTQEKIIIN